MSTMFPNPVQDDGPAEASIKNSNFWPDIEPADFRIAQRVDYTITTARVRGSLVRAIVEVNKQLKTFRLEHIENGITSLDLVEAEVIDGESILIGQYKDAVYNYAKSYLIGRYSDFDSTGGADRGDSKNKLADDILADAHAAIAAITGDNRVRAYLI